MYSLIPGGRFFLVTHGVCEERQGARVAGSAFECVPWHTLALHAVTRF